MSPSTQLSSHWSFMRDIIIVVSQHSRLPSFTLFSGWAALLSVHQPKQSSSGGSSSRIRRNKRQEIKECSRSPSTFSISLFWSLSVRRQKIFFLQSPFRLKKSFLPHLLPVFVLLQPKPKDNERGKIKTYTSECPELSLYFCLERKKERKKGGGR